MLWDLRVAPSPSKGLGSVEGETASQLLPPALVPECLYATGLSQHILHVSTIVCKICASIWFCLMPVARMRSAVCQLSKRVPALHSYKAQAVITIPGHYQSTRLQDKGHHLFPSATLQRFLLQLRWCSDE